MPCAEFLPMPIPENNTATRFNQFVGPWTDHESALASGSAFCAGIQGFPHAHPSQSDHSREWKRQLIPPSMPHRCTCIDRWFRAWTGRAFIAYSAAKVSICSLEAEIDSVITTQLTTSEQGGVVREPT